MTVLFFDTESQSHSDRQIFLTGNESSALQTFHPRRPSESRPVECSLNRNNFKERIFSTGKIFFLLTVEDIYVSVAKTVAEKWTVYFPERPPKWSRNRRIQFGFRRTKNISRAHRNIGVTFQYTRVARVTFRYYSANDRGFMAFCSPLHHRQIEHRHCVLYLSELANKNGRKVPVISPVSPPPQ